MSKENITRLAGFGSLSAGALAVAEGIRRDADELLYLGIGLEGIALLAFASLFFMSPSKTRAV